MALAKKHNFKFTNESLHRIDSFLPKLKYSVLPSKLVRWFENFEEKDLSLIYDILQVFEYITFSEMQYRLEDLLKSIFSELDENDNVLVIPFGKFGKSGTLVSYPLTHSDFYKKTEKEGRITISNDFKKYDKVDITCVVLLDDFIGSGNTFCTDYVKEGIEAWISSKNIAKRYILSTIIMSDGKTKIETSFGNIKIFAQERGKLFDHTKSPLKVFGNAIDYTMVNNKYEKQIKIHKDYLKGFRGSESLIAFTHGTPNNTIPIFWWENNKWIPLLPRHAKTRMDEARQFKKEIAFYIGICNRLGVDLLELDKHIFKIKKDGIERQRKYNNQSYHSLIALVKLKDVGTEDYIISHILGLTDYELIEVYELARSNSFVDASNTLTVKATTYLKELDDKTRKERFRPSTKDNLEMKDIKYIPLSFKGLT